MKFCSARWCRWAAAAAVAVRLLPLAAWGLAPNEVAVIANPTFPQSRELAEYYCQRRGIPSSHILGVAMSREEKISRRDYAERIAPLLRECLKQADFGGRIKCLVTVRGVPLKIGAFVPSGETASWRDLIQEQIDRRFQELHELIAQADRLAGRQGPADPLASASAFRLPRGALERSREARNLLRQAQQSLDRARAALGQAQKTAVAPERQRQQLEELEQQWSGLIGKQQRLLTRLRATPLPSEERSLKAQVAELDAKIRPPAERIKSLQGRFETAAGQREKYDLLYEVGGLQTLCQLLVHDRLRIDDELSEAAFDSELALVLWPSYSLLGYQKNPLHQGPVPADELAGAAEPNQTGCPTFMVARLDGPSHEIAQGLIDKALAGEQTSLAGTAYIDARGIHDKVEQFGSFGYYDEALRQTARLLRRQTGLKVVLDDQAELFSPGACPDTTLYCGWYKLRDYVDSFTFNVGAVGYHIASVEAETLRTGQPDSNAWCKRMLEHGITATLGPVGEPYLHAIALPDRFFGDLVRGQYCLAECFARNNPYNSWTVILIGDPLYRPRFAGSKAVGSAVP